MWPVRATDKERRPSVFAWAQLHPLGSVRSQHPASGQDSETQARDAQYRVSGSCSRRTGRLRKKQTPWISGVLHCPGALGVTRRHRTPSFSSPSSSLAPSVYGAPEPHLLQYITLWRITLHPALSPSMTPALGWTEWRWCGYRDEGQMAATLIFQSPVSGSDT